MDFSNINKLVKSGADERSLQAEFKKDLSLLGSACAHSAIRDEYIAFSEFPIGRGKADFVVFTDRSRMDVIIIEIKGADFNFINKNGSVAAQINKAALQIGERRYQIQNNYEPFRRDVHAIRMAVESGENKFNSVLGSNGYLHVDPNKDIDVRGLVIGGRTKSDLEESKIRHQLEMANSKVMFESWDSWLRKYSMHKNS